MEKLPDGDKEVSSTQPSQTEIKRIEETRYELRDASGEVRCTVAVQFDYRIPQGTTLYQKGETKTPLKHIINMSLESDGKSVSLLALEGIPKETAIMMVDDNCHYGGETDEVFVPEPKTLADVYIILHELGHAAQSREDKYKKIYDYTGGLRAVNLVEQFSSAAVLLRELGIKFPLPNETIAELEKFSHEVSSTKDEMDENDLEAIDKTCCKLLDDFILKRFPELRNEIYHKEFDISHKEEHITWKRRYKAFLEILNKYHLLSIEVKKEVDNLIKQSREMFDIQKALFDKSHAKMIAAYDAFNEILGDHQNLPFDIVMKVPVAIAERDASFRALRWVRKISKEAGINLNFPINAGEAESFKNILENLEKDPGGRSEEYIKAVLKICGQKEVSARKVLDLGLLSQDSGSSVNMFLFRK